MQAREVLEACLYVDDLEAAERFYRDVLGLAFVSRQPGRHVFFRCGDRMVLLFQPTESSKTGQDLPPHGARGAGHLAFSATSDELPQWRAHLQRCGVPVEQELDWPGGGKSLYFRDPAGNSLELATPEIWGLA